MGLMDTHSSFNNAEISYVVTARSPLPQNVHNKWKIPASIKQHRLVLHHGTDTTNKQKKLTS